CYGYAEARLPAGVTVAPDGSVYSTEDYYHLIRHVTATGFTSNAPPGQLPLFNTPMGLALNSSNTVLYVADTGNNAVQVLDLGNNQTTTFLNANNGLSRPVGVVVDPSDNRKVLSQGTGAIGTVLDFESFVNHAATR